MGGTAFKILLAAAFTSAFSAPVGRGFLLLALIFTIADHVKRREFPRLPAVTWLMLLFSVSAIVSTVVGIDPAGSWPHLRKLIWYFAIPVYAVLVTSGSQLSAILKAFAVGAGVLAVRDLIVLPVKAHHLAMAGGSGSFYDALVSLGSMTDAQRYMVGILITLGVMVLCKKEGRRAPGWWMLLALQVVALLLTFKRGSLLCLMLVSVVFVALKTNWKYLVVLVTLAVLTLLLPPVRARMSKTVAEFDVNKGGRATMWFSIAPAMHKEYPWLGIGWRAMTPQVMKSAADRIGVPVEPNRNHLHSNPAQILVETGWIGFALYMMWMSKGVADGVRFAWRAKALARRDEFSAAILLLMLIALLLNGLVEFNFADAEIVLIYGLSMGCIAAGNTMLEKQIQT